MRVGVDQDTMAHSQENALDGVAVIGMAGRFPGARNLEEFWANLAGGVESIRPLTDEELLQAGVDPSLVRNPAYVKRGTRLDEADCFDASFFGYLPREAEVMDPQHRVFLECAWHALENAGYDPSACPGSVGVFGGCGLNTYLLNNLCANPRTRPMVTEFSTMLGNDKDFLAVRVAYKLNLKGPAVTVQTACSTSLVAVVHAWQALQNYQCDVALAGGSAVQPAGVASTAITQMAQGIGQKARVYRVEVSGLNNYRLHKRSNTVRFVSFDKMLEAQQAIHRQGGRVVSVTPVN